VLGDRIGIAHAIPMLGKKVPQRYRDYQMFLRQGAKHRRPDPEITERTVDADQRRAVISCLADLKIGHVISVDAKGLHWGLVRVAGQDSGLAVNQSFN
jgi:hypothetical protein